MDFQQLYLSDQGRLSRKSWWLASIGLMIIGIIVAMVIGVPAGLLGLTNSSFGNGLIELVLLAILFVPYRSLTLKRLHDRDRPENLFWIFIAPTAVSAVAKLLGIAGSVQTIEMFGTRAEAYQPNMIGHLINLAALGIGLWGLWELGIQKGNPGPNAHGPDPLGDSGPAETVV